MTIVKHRHERTSWLIAGGYIEWCYVCGAWRHLRKIENISNGWGPYRSGEFKGWRKPSGNPKKNPYVFKIKS